MGYREALLRAIEEWKADPILDEWSFEKFRENIIASMSAVEAFDAISETVGVLLDEVDESTATEIVQTILGLARQSETTEIPSALLINQVKLQDKFSFFGGYAQDKLRELFRHYRI